MTTHIGYMEEFTSQGIRARSVALDKARDQLEALATTVKGRDERLVAISESRRFLGLGSVRQAHIALREAVALLAREGSDTTTLARLIEAAHKTV